MLADINLLPKKPAKNVANYVTLLVTLLGIVIGLIVLHQQITTLQREQDNIDFQRQVVEADIARLEEELAMIEATHSDAVTQQNINYALSQTILTTEIIREVRMHLPENANIERYVYTSGEALNFRILVDESPEVGYFVESIAEIPWINQARVDSVTVSGTRWIGNVSVILNRAELVNWQWEVTNR